MPTLIRTLKGKRCLREGDGWEEDEEQESVCDTTTLNFFMSDSNFLFGLRFMSEIVTDFRVMFIAVKTPPDLIS